MEPQTQNGAGMGKLQVEPKRQGQVAAQIEGLRCSVDSLETCLLDLMQGLEVASMPSTPIEAVKGPDADLVPLAREIKVNTKRVLLMAEEIRSQIERLEL